MDTISFTSASKLSYSFTVPRTSCSYTLSSSLPCCSNKIKICYGSKIPRRRPNTSILRRSGITCGLVEEISETQFSDVVLKSDRPVLVEFAAPWCGPCRLIGPAVESIAEEYKEKLRVVKLDHDSNPGLIEEYKVYGLPALILFKDGKEVTGSRREGAITKVKLKEYVDALLNSVSVA